MIRALARALGVAALGALAGAIGVVVAFTLHPAIALEMDRDLPRIVSGIYPPERDRDLTFAWTSGKAEVRLRGLDRRTPWTCSVTYRGGRAVPPQPVVTLAIDGIALASRTATNEYEEARVTAPEQDRPGLTFTVTSEPTVVPGPQDRRELGVQVDRLACRPDASATALPPRRTITRAMLACGIFGAALALIGITAGTAIGATLLVAIAQAWPLSLGIAPYVPYVDKVPYLAFWIGAVMLASIYGCEWIAANGLRQTARFVIAFSAVTLYLKLLALLHPAKPIIDALFQAHRFEWVLSGRYLFTQAMPGGVQFPYAIGLYVFAAPWSSLTRDYVALLRVVVTASEVVAGALLYVMVARARGDRLAAAAATALFALVPMTYWFVGAANMTNVFGQSVALATMVALTTLALQRGRASHVVILTALAAWAMLCHVSTFATLAATLLFAAIFYWIVGGPAVRTPARRTVIATLAAALVAVAVYYGHFIEVYKDALRVRAQTAAAAQTATPEAPATPPATKYRAFTPLHVRIFDALVLSGRSLGWPVFALAIAGAVFTWRQRARDRLTCAILAWSATYLVFLIVGVMRVDVQYQRYSYEFVGRATFATYPAAILLAAHGAAWGWRAGTLPRFATAAALLAATIGGVRSWMDWLQ
jgi:hypothetical protein